jgi:hypothetical protein
MAAYTSELYNHANELDSRSTFDDNEPGQPPSLDRAIAWCESQMEQHNNSPYYTPGWTAKVIDDATQAVVWPEE